MNGFNEIRVIYEIRPRRDKCGVDLNSDVLQFGRLWYGEPDVTSDAINCAKFFSRLVLKECCAASKADDGAESSPAMWGIKRLGWLKVESLPAVGFCGSVRSRNIRHSRNIPSIACGDCCDCCGFFRS
jgi:hypothetical protein